MQMVVHLILSHHLQDLSKSSTRPLILSNHGIDLSIFEKCHHNIIFGKISIRISLPLSYVREVRYYKKLMLRVYKKLFYSLDFLSYYSIDFLMGQSFRKSFCWWESCRFKWNTNETFWKLYSKKKSNVTIDSLHDKMTK